jgi:transposase-like protein
VALEALKGGKTIAQLAAHYVVHANQITSCETQLLENAAGIFGAGVVEGAPDRERIRELHAKIGELTSSAILWHGARSRPRPTYQVTPHSTRASYT